MATRLGSVLTVFLGFMLSLAAAADTSVPECPDHGQPLGINNDQVLSWKATTPNQYTARAHVQGTITQVLDNTNGHQHFLLQIGASSDQIVEIIYNTDFGPISDIEPGMTAEACGDFIQSFAQAGPYPPSPAGAIIHWVHLNPSYRGHDPGFLEIDDTLYGQDTSNAGPNPHDLN